MSKKLSRRDFLRLTGAASAAGALSLSGLNTFPVFAQDADISLLTWGHFISSQNSLLQSLSNSWATEAGVSVEINFGGFPQLADTLATAAATGAGPDIMMMLYARPHQFAEALVDVSDICEEIGEANGGWYDVARQTCVVDGVWRAMPWYFAAHGMVYRQDLFAEAGVEEFPDTWEGLLEAGAAIKSAGLPPLGFSVGRADGDGNNFCFGVLWSFGASVTDEEGAISLDTPETRQALEFVQQFYNDAMDPNVITWDDGANNQAYLAGEVSCTNNASSILWAGRRNGIDFMETTSHAPYPSGPAGRLNLVQTHSMGILNYAENVDAAKEYLRFLNSQEAWLPLGVDSFAFNSPMFRSLEDNPAMPWNFDPALAAFKGLGESGRMFGFPGTPSAAASEVASTFVITDMFGSVCAGAASIDEAIETAISQVEDIYGM